jgi:hypothetical protein
MEFSPEKAQEIADKHNLSKGIVRLWKHRNEIPEVYFREDSVQELQLLEYLSNPKLNPKAICNNANVSYNKYIAANRTDKYHVHFGKEDVDALFKEIEKIRKNCTFFCNFLGSKATYTEEEKLLIEEFLLTSPITAKNFLENDDKIYKRFLRRKSKNNPAKIFNDFDVKVYLAKIKILGSELQ